MKKMIAFFCLSALIFNNASVAQNSVSFLYHNKPVNPEALVPLFPSMADGKSADLVDLDTFVRPVVRDTNFWLRSKSEIWWRCDLSDPGAFTFYNVLGTVNDKFIVVAYFNDGGTLTQVAVFFLVIKGHMLYKLGGFYPREAPDKIEIKNDEVIYLGRHYKVPG